MERRVLLAVLLSFLVLYGYQAMLPTPPDPKPAQAQKPQASSRHRAERVGRRAASNPTASVQGEPRDRGAGRPRAAVPEREIVVETRDVRGVFTTRGARAQELAAEEVSR